MNEMIWHFILLFIGTGALQASDVYLSIDGPIKTLVAASDAARFVAKPTRIEHEVGNGHIIPRCSGVTHP